MVANGVLAVISIVLFVVSLQIETQLDDPWGPKIAPLAVASLMALGSFTAIALEILATRHLQKPVAETGTGPDAPDPIPGMKLAQACILGLAYCYGMTVIGYLVATIVFLFFSLALFGNRNVRTMAIVAGVGGLIYDTVFIRLMGLSDPGFDLLAALSIY